MGAISLYLVLPIIATIIYSFSISWVRTILPEGITLKWYIQLLSSSDFIIALIHSLILGIITTIISLAVFLPIVFYSNVYNTNFKSVLQFITILPFTVPGIILVTGLVKLYTTIEIPKFIILVLAISLLSLPLTYQTLNNAFMARDFRSMFEQAMVLGDKPIKAFGKVIMPNIRIGVFIAMLLTFTSAFGEYVLTNILLGGNYETLKIYMYRLMQSNGQACSVLTAIYFLFLGTMSFIMVLFMKNNKKNIKIKGDS